MRRIKREARVADLATQEIRTAILAGTLAPGSRVTQEDLAARLGVSRVPIRQALSALEREGLVQAHPRHGTVVTPLDADVIRDVYEFRGAIDRHVAHTLAERRDFRARPFHELIEVGRVALQTAEPPRVIELDLRFHTGLCEAVGNAVLTEVMRAQWAHIRRLMAVTLTASGYHEHVWEEHAGILAAIETHDPDRAGALAAAHADSACANLIERLSHLTRAALPLAAASPLSSAGDGAS